MSPSDDRKAHEITHIQAVQEIVRAIRTLVKSQEAIVRGIPFRRQVDARDYIDGLARADGALQDAVKALDGALRAALDAPND